MTTEISDRFAVSTWSLHRHLGITYPHDLDSLDIGPYTETYGEGSQSLLDIPSAIANHGINRLEICSFHIRSRDPIYLQELRDAMATVGVTLQSLLIEAGDISDPATSARDTAWIASWIETANALGAEHARIIAGKQPPTLEALDRSAAALLALANGNAGPVRLVTENWFDLLSEPAHVHYLLDKLAGRVGLNADFGNWDRSSKYEELRSIFPRAETCHAKAQFIDGDLDEADYGACLDAAEAAGYKGPYTLIFNEEIPGEWAGIEAEKRFIEERLKGR